MIYQTKQENNYSDQSINGYVFMRGEYKKHQAMFSQLLIIDLKQLIKKFFLEVLRTPSLNKACLNKL